MPSQKWGREQLVIWPLIMARLRVFYLPVGQTIYFIYQPSILELEIRNKMLVEEGIVYLNRKIKSHFFLPKVESDLAY